MRTLYKTNAVSVGGRDGQTYVEKTPVRFEMALPKELGGAKEVGFNPEQLFAAGYAACFGSAMQHVFRERKLTLPPPQVNVTVGIGRNDANKFQLEVAIHVVFTGVEQDAAERLVAEAHEVCPYSSATRGNIEVTLSAKAE